VSTEKRFKLVEKTKADVALEEVLKWYFPKYFKITSTKKKKKIG